jgi:choline dehydrogenase-like flavoprotein
MLPPEHGGPDAAALAGHVDRFLTRLSPAGRAGVLTLMWGLDGVAVATTGRRLARLDGPDRERVLERVGATGIGRDALDACKATISLVSGADSFAADMWERSARAAPARPDAELRLTPSSSWPSTSHCDVIVIGSGAGGAFAARTLARAGLDTVVLEEGRRFTVEEFRTRHPADRFGELYRDGGATIAIGRPPVVLPIGRGVGGTTLVNSGTCYRTPDQVVTDWRERHGLELVGGGGFDARLDDVEQTLEVDDVPLAIMGNNGLALLRGAERLGWSSGPLRRNAPGCGGCCQCAVGCPSNAKLGVHLNALPQACEAGAHIVSELRVVRVLHDAERATGVLAVRPDGSAVEITADQIVVSAGATETPPLLRRSGLGRHHRLGRNLALHPALSAAGLFEDEVTAWEGVLQSSAVDHFHEQDHVLIEATSTPPGMGSMALPGHGRELLRWIEAAPHLVTLGAMVGDRGNGRVLGRRHGRTLLTYKVGDVESARLLRALRYMGQALFAAGATSVLTGIPGAEVVASDDELCSAVAGADVRRLHLAAFHPTGTAAAGGDAQRHPVDARGRLRGVRGVSVADASILPTCPEVNPQVTIMALATAVADEIVDGLAR